MTTSLLSWRLRTPPGVMTNLTTSITCDSRFRAFTFLMTTTTIGAADQASWLGGTGRMRAGSVGVRVLQKGRRT